VRTEGALHAPVADGDDWVTRITSAFANDASSTTEDKDTMENIASISVEVEQAKPLALQAVHNQLSHDVEYTTTVKDKRNSLEVWTLPKGRVRGGGAKVIVSQQPMKVLKTYFLQ
jgi:hypothetical protein